MLGPKYIGIEKNDEWENARKKIWKNKIILEINRASVAKGQKLLSNSSSSIGGT